MKVNPSVSSGVQATDLKQTQEADKSKRADQVKKAQDAYRSPPSDSTDVQADLSAKSKELAKAHSLAMSTPDVREDKVADLKRRISEGRYEINADKIADKMVSEHLGSA